MVDAIGRVIAATLVADVGGLMGVAVSSTSLRRLGTLVWCAVGAMLAVTLFDIVPETARVLGPGLCGLSLLCGASAFWAIERFVFPICPSCAIEELSSGTLLRSNRGIALLLGVLAIHSSLDGIGLVAGDHLQGHADLALLLGLSLHKLPEGLALSLLLVGAGVTRRTTVMATFAVESLTLLGGGLGLIWFGSAAPAWVAFAIATVGGGFVYLAARTAGGCSSSGRTNLMAAAAMSFTACSLFIAATQ